MSDKPTPEELAELNSDKPTAAELAELNGAAPAAPKKEYPLDKFVNAAVPAVVGLGKRVVESSDPFQQLRTLYTGKPSMTGEALGDKPAPAADRARAAMQGASFNHADEAVSALDSLFGKKTYKEALAENRPAYEQAVKAAPSEYLGAAIASPNPLSKLSLPDKMGFGGRVLSTTAQSALGGGLAAEGGSTKPLLETGPEIGRGLEGGAALGFGGGAVAEGLRGLSPAIRKAAEEQAFKSFGARVDLGAAKNKLKAIDARAPAGDPTGARRELGRLALDEKLVRPFGTAAGVAERTEPALDTAGEVQGGLLGAIADQHKDARVSLPAVATDLENQGNRALMMPSGADTGKALLGQSKNMRDAAMRRQSGGLGDYLDLLSAESEKRALQRKPNYAVVGADQSAAEEARKAAASSMRRAVEDEVERVGGPDELEPWKAAKQKTGRLQDILDVSQYGAQREASKGGGPTMFEVGQQGVRHAMGPAGVAADAALGAASNLWKQRRPATLANAYDEASRIAKGPTASRFASRAGSLAEYLDQLKEQDK